MLTTRISGIMRGSKILSKSEDKTPIFFDKTMIFCSKTTVRQVTIYRSGIVPIQRKLTHESDPVSERSLILRPAGPLINIEKISNKSRFKISKISYIMTGMATLIPLCIVVMTNQ